MRTSGMIEYITPLQIATESSTTPKSVMNTIVCGYFAFCAPANGECPSSSSTTTTMASPLPRRVAKRFDPRFGFERARLFVAPQSLIKIDSGFSRMLSAPQPGLQSVGLQEYWGFRPPANRALPSLRSIMSCQFIARPQGGLMSEAIPEKYRDLFQKRAFASLGTLMPDGRPQVTPVWCDYDGEHVIFNSAKGRQKDRNVRRDPRVSLAVIDPENPYRYMEIRGRVVEITEEGASASIDKLAKKYLGVDKYPYGQPGEVRVIYKIKPEHTTVMG